MKTPDESGDSDGLDTRRMKGSLEQRLFGTAVDPVRVGRFVVIDRLGQGGMGTVFRAYDPDLNRRVALKVLRKTSIAEPEREARLVREAQALAKLNHPNVVAVYEVGLLVGRIFVAMEHVEGVELGTWARSLPPPGLPRYRQALEILIQAGSGLAAAHAAGLVHRVFKPTNVLVGDDGRARVLDFGLAR
ncbi:MAG: serine/threonine protein kinase, partial [Nannocystaceae bacterium]|nr:serine/threonine protein kinase [Nannocystaceae bacterium]